METKSVVVWIHAFRFEGTGWRARNEVVSSCEKHSHYVIVGFDGPNEQLRCWFNGKPASDSKRTLESTISNWIIITTGNILSSNQQPLVYWQDLVDPPEWMARLPNFISTYAGLDESFSCEAVSRWLRRRGDDGGDRYWHPIKYIG